MQKGIVCAVVAVALFGVLGIAVAIGLSIDKMSGPALPNEFGIVIDAGSSHSQVTVFTWPGRTSPGTSLVQIAPVIKSQAPWICTSAADGISSFVDNPAAAGPSLVPCINTTTHEIPVSQQSATPILLGATAGMRLLQAANATAAAAVMSSVSLTMSQTPYYFTNQSAQILSGAEEGTCGWIQTNYLLDNLMASPQPGSMLPTTVGALDLGGASTQISFVTPVTIPSGYASPVNLFGYHYPLFTYSFLKYGQNQALESLVQVLSQQQNFSLIVANPCLPIGYSANLSITDSTVTYLMFGTSNITSCLAVTQLLFNKTTPCPYSSCSFNGAFLPPLVSTYYAFSGFIYPIQFFGLGLTPTFQQILSATSTYCSRTWANITATYNTTDPSRLWNYCFQGAYVYELLTYGYGMNDSITVHFQNGVGDTPFGWSMGWMVNVTNLLPIEKPPTPVPRISASSAAIIGSISAAFLLADIVFIIVLLRARPKRGAVGMNASLLDNRF